MMTNNWTETPEMDRYSLAEGAFHMQRTLFEGAKSLYRKAHWARKQAQNDTDAKIRDYHVSVAESFERQAEDYIDTLRGKGVLIER